MIVQIGTFYHGSKDGTYSSLNINWSIDNPFGAGIYLTREPIVASCYGSSIYEVEGLRSSNFTINLNGSFRSQTVEAREAILKTVKALGLNFARACDVKVRGLIHPFECNTVDVNRLLAAQGIWMVYGTLSGMEVSGLKDRGIQYVVIDESAIRIKQVTNYYDLVKPGVDRA